MYEATLKDGQKAVYTEAVLPWLLEDDFIVEIVDMETGELLKWGEA